MLADGWHSVLKTDIRLKGRWFDSTAQRQVPQNQANIRILVQTNFVLLSMPVFPSIVRKNPQVFGLGV